MLSVISAYFRVSFLIGSPWALGRSPVSYLDTRILYISASWSMGQSSSQATDAVKPGTISGPMPLGTAVGGRPRSMSGDSNRQRRERRRSRDVTSTPSSPTITHTALVSSPQTRPTLRQDSISTIASAPPPYTPQPSRREFQLAEAPPPQVLPRESTASSRDYGYLQDKKPPISFGQAAESVQPQSHPHRRTVSHSVLAGPSQARSMSPGSRRRMPSLIPSSAPSFPGGFRAEVAQVASRTESLLELRSDSPDNTEASIAGSAEHTPVVSSRRGSKEDPLEMLRWVRDYQISPTTE